MHALRVRALLSLATALLVTACGEDPGQAPGAPSAPGGLPASTQTLLTHHNPPPGADPVDVARHVDFTLRHPSTWQVDAGYRKEDKRGFARLRRPGERVDLAFVVRSFRRAQPERTAESFIDGFDAGDARSVQPHQTRTVLHKGATTVSGRPGVELVTKSSEKDEQDGLTRHSWNRVVLVPLAATEWGCLMIDARIVGLYADVDPLDPALQREIQDLFDGLAITP